MDDADIDSFNDATDECNTVHLQICEERGIDPVESALDYERANATKSKEAQAESAIPDLEEVDDENEDDDIAENEVCFVAEVWS